MTIAELKELLSKYPDHYKVNIDNGEEFYRVTEVDANQVLEEVLIK